MIKQKQQQTLTLLFLNIQGGEYIDALLPYLQGLAGQIDVFGFQEVLETPLTGVVYSDQPNYPRQRVDIYRQLQCALPGHQPYFAGYSSLPAASFPVYIGNALFVRKGINVVSEGDTMVYRARDSMRGSDVATLPRSVQHAVLQFPRRKRLTVFNFHGLWQPEGKKDTPKRLAQSRRLLQVVQEFPQPWILGGDFNTYPTSKASAVLEKAGFQNLVHANGVTSTRSSLYTRGVKNGWHADNVFTLGIKVVQFMVDGQAVVADHLPMALKCAW